MSLLNFSLTWPINALGEIDISHRRVGVRDPGQEGERIHTTPIIAELVEVIRHHFTATTGGRDLDTPPYFVALLKNYFLNRDLVLVSHTPL